MNLTINREETCHGPSTKEDGHPRGHLLAPLRLPQWRQGSRGIEPLDRIGQSVNRTHVGPPCLGGRNRCYEAPRR